MKNFYGCTFYFHDEDIAMKLSGLTDMLDAYIAKAVKINGEINGRIAELQQDILDLRAELLDVTLPESAVEKIAILEAHLQALDDIVVDAEEPVAPVDPVDPVE